MNKNIKLILIIKCLGLMAGGLNAFEFEMPAQNAKDGFLGKVVKGGESFVNKSKSSIKDLLDPKSSQKKLESLEKNTKTVKKEQSEGPAACKRANLHVEEAQKAQKTKEALSLNEAIEEFLKTTKWANPKVPRLKHDEFFAGIIGTLMNRLKKASAGIVENSQALSQTLSKGGVGELEEKIELLEKANCSLLVFIDQTNGVFISIENAFARLSRISSQNSLKQSVKDLVPKYQELANAFKQAHENIMSTPRAYASLASNTLSKVKDLQSMYRLSRGIQSIQQDLDLLLIKIDYSQIDPSFFDIVNNYVDKLIEFLGKHERLLKELDKDLVETADEYKAAFDAKAKI